jgi:hypothetical protein
LECILRATGSKEARLLPHIGKVSLSGYWKDRDTGKRIHILIRNDRYHLEPISEKEGYIVLEDFDLKIKYDGGLGGRVDIECLRSYMGLVGGSPTHQ